MKLKNTYKFLKPIVNELAFLNCLIEYPPLYEDLNLSFIGELRSLFPDVTIGHSDSYTRCLYLLAAVTLGAKIIEKHVILDKRTPAQINQYQLILMI